MDFKQFIQDKQDLPFKPGDVVIAGPFTDKSGNLYYRHAEVSSLVGSDRVAITFKNGEKVVVDRDILVYPEYATRANHWTFQ